MTEQPTALRLADEIAEMQPKYVTEPVAAELRRLHAEAEESEALRERLSALLTGTAIALRGPATELVSWSWHDLPERAAALVAQRDALLSALLWIDKRCPQAFMDCPLHTIHREMAHDAGACARAAIKAVEGGEMTTQPEALRLADALDGEFVQGRISNHTGRKAAAELRRLHRECEILSIERDHARIMYENAVKLLTSIHSCMYPNAVKMEELAIIGVVSVTGLSLYAIWRALT